MAAVTEAPRSRFAQGAWERAWPAALLAATLAAAAFAVELAPGEAPRAEITIESTAPVAWSISRDGQPGAGDEASPQRWRGSAATSAHLVIDAAPAVSGAGVALRVRARCGARAGETVVWGGHVDLHLAELLHGDAP